MGAMYRSGARRHVKIWMAAILLGRLFFPSTLPAAWVCLQSVALFFFIVIVGFLVGGC